MTSWEAPAKLNLSLELRPPDRTGYHPLRSLVQTIEWLDLLEVSTGEDERLVIEGDDLPEGEDNLVWKAVRALVGRPDQPRLDVTLTKTIPHAAGLGGGSADAAAALRGAAEIYGRTDEDVRSAALQVGADVPYFLDGGARWMEGYGEVLTEVEPLSGFCVAVVVPLFEIATPEAYARWDSMEGPPGPGMEGRALPPGLRAHGPLRNDLTPAAIALHPELGDWAADLASHWARPVAMTGSGPAYFGYFIDIEEAREAARSVPAVRAAMGAELRGRGVRSR